MTITPSTIASAIDSAPVWATLALSMRSEKLREDARREIGEHVFRSLFTAVDVDRDQLALPL